MSNIQELIVTLQDFSSLSEERKNFFIEALENENFSDDIAQQIDNAFAEEIIFQEAQLQKEQAEIGEKKEELIQKKEEGQKGIKKLLGEFFELCKKRFDEFVQETQEIEKEMDTEEEKVHHKEESSEIDAIRSQLLQK